MKSEIDFDVYIVDLVLKTMSGKSIILKLRESGIESVIITISGIDHFRTVSNVLSIGADDYVTKPFNTDLFMARLKTNVRSYLLLQEVKRLIKYYEKRNIKHYYNFIIDKIMAKFTVNLSKSVISRIKKTNI